MFVNEQEPENEIMLSIIIPVYNGEKYILDSLFCIENYGNLFFSNFEIIVVDDGSIDSTLEKAISFSSHKNNVSVLHYDTNQGKGFAVREGMLHARYDNMLLTDIDMSTPINEIHNLLLYKDFDVVIGSRDMPDSIVKEQQTIARRVVGKSFGRVSRSLFGLQYRDTQCGFKLFRNCKDIFEEQSIFGWTFDIELLIIAQAKGKKIIEVPVEWNNNADSRLRICSAFMPVILELIRIKIKTIRALYTK